MKFYQSIRFRVLAVLLLFGALLLVINSIVTFFVVGRNIDRLIDNLLATEVEYFLYQYEKDRATPLPRSKFIKAYDSIDQLRPRIRELVKGLGPGVHSLRHRTDRPPWHVGVIQLPDRPGTFYLFFHGREFFREKGFLDPRDILLVSLALLLIPGAIIALLFSRLLIRPMNALVGKIRALNPEEIPDNWADRSIGGEIGMLTRSIETAMQRIKAFIQREKQFTRDASHELRTPLTIVKGAVEIMEQQPETHANPLLQKPLTRISRSVSDMETTIETFLWLAREENEPGENNSGQTCRVGPVLDRAAAGNRHLITDRDVALVLEMRHDPVLPVKEEVLYIAVANLVRNAFQFTPKGSVTIISDTTGITIRDTGMGIEPDRLDQVTQAHTKGARSRGFGLGLSIVSRLCKRFGWELHIDSTPGQGTEVRIEWGRDADRDLQGRA